MKSQNFKLRLIEKIACSWMIIRISQLHKNAKKMYLNHVSSTDTLKTEDFCSSLRIRLETKLTHNSWTKSKEHEAHLLTSPLYCFALWIALSFRFLFNKLENMLKLIYKNTNLLHWRRKDLFRKLYRVIDQDDGNAFFIF